MEQQALAHEPLIRLTATVVIFVAVAGWEFVAPRRTLTCSRWLRWSNNLALALVNAGAVRVVMPVLAMGVAASAQQQGWGLLNQWGMAPAVAFVLALLALDLAIYLQHVMFHAVPALWRLHRMHHADLDFDVTTGLRFHPVEKIGRAHV